MLVFETMHFSLAHLVHFNGNSGT